MIEGEGQYFRVLLLCFFTQVCADGGTESAVHGLRRRVGGK